MTRITDTTPPANDGSLHLHMAQGKNSIPGYSLTSALRTKSLLLPVLLPLLCFYSLHTVGLQFKLYQIPKGSEQYEMFCKFRQAVE